MSNIVENIKKEILSFLKDTDINNILNDVDLCVSIAHRSVYISFEDFIFIRCIKYIDDTDYKLNGCDKVDIDKFDKYINILSFLKENNSFIEDKIKSLI